MRSMHMGVMLDILQNKWCYTYSFNERKKLDLLIHFKIPHVSNLRHQTIGSTSFVCLVIWSLSSHLRIVHSYGNVTIAVQGLEMFDQCSALMVIEQWGFFNMPHPFQHEPIVYNGHLPGPVTLTPAPHLLFNTINSE